MSTEPKPTTGASGDDDRTQVLGAEPGAQPADGPTAPTLTDLPAHDAAPTTQSSSAPATHDPTPVAPVERPERGPRVGTVVWGLVLAVLGVGVLAWAGGRHIDVDVAAIVLVAGAGVALLVGSIVSGARRRR